MDCTEARHHWNLYHDSEGDAWLHFEIEEHLANCPDCAEWFSKQSRLEAMVVEKLREGPAEPGLWARVLDNAGVKPRRKSRHWFWAVGVAASAAAAVLIIVGIVHLHRKPSAAELGNQSAAWHDRLSSGREPVQYASSSDHEVEEFLRSRVSFPVRCPPRKDAGFTVRGAGVGRLDRFDAAYLSGIVGEDSVSIFVLPRDSLAAFELPQAVRAGSVHHEQAGPYATVLREFDRNAIVVVGRTSPQALERVVNAYGSYPDEH